MAGTSASGGTQRPGLRAYEYSLALDVPELVDKLRAMLGARLVAYIVSTHSTSTVSAWADGSARPSAIQVDRLRLTYRIAAMLNERYTPPTIQTWLRGHGPALGGAAPAVLLREEQLTLIEDDLVDAATSFAYDGRRLTGDGGRGAG